MSLLITGATGFIGKRVVHYSLQQGIEVTILTQSPEAAKEIFDSKVKIIDLKGFLNGEMQLGCDKAIHLGWSNVQDYKNSENLSQNLSSQLRLLDKLIEAGIDDITVTGTCLEYGMVEGACKEDMPVKEPLPTPYANAKHQLHKWLQQYKNINLKWIRCFYVYGLGQRPNSLLSMLLAAIENGEKEFNMSGGQQKRDFIHVDSLAKNIISVARQSDVTGVINAGCGVPITVLQFVQKILEIKNYDMKLNLGYYPYSENEPMEFWADVEKLKTIEKSVFNERIYI